MLLLGIYIYCVSIATTKAMSIVSHREDVVGSEWPIDPICGFVAATNIETIYPSWSCNVSGVPNSDACNWHGVSCSVEGELVSILVQDNKLVGTLTPSLGSIASIDEISILLTNITGSLPSSWGFMIGMQKLDLSSNSLTGSLPSSWGSMTGMQQLHLHSNSLAGSLPSS